MNQNGKIASIYTRKSLRASAILDKITSTMKNVKENALIARNPKFRIIGESKHILCMFQHSLEEWMMECTHLDDKSLAILTNIDNKVSLWDIFGYM